MEKNEKNINSNQKIKNKIIKAWFINKNIITDILNTLIGFIKYII
jgi:hypothetical protein